MVIRYRKMVYAGKTLQMAIRKHIATLNDSFNDSLTNQDDVSPSPPVNPQISRESSSQLHLLRQKMNQQRLSTNITPSQAPTSLTINNVQTTSTDTDATPSHIVLKHFKVDDSKLRFILAAVRGWITRKLFKSVYCKSIPCLI